MSSSFSISSSCYGSFHHEFKRLFIHNSFIKLDYHACMKQKLAICGYSTSQIPCFNLDKKTQKSSLKVGLVKTLLIDNYDSYTYNIYQELSVINGIPPVVVRNDEWSWEVAHHYLYEEKAFDNIVISPGPGSPTRAADIGICLQLLRECEDIPILGVCLGHQALGHVHGARVIQAPEPVHGRLSEIEHNNCKLFHGIPSGKNSGFKVVRYHSLVIDLESLPNDILPIAWSSGKRTIPFIKAGPNMPCSSDDNNSLALASDAYLKQKILMGVMHPKRPHYGLQFHPESIATCYGRLILENFKEITISYLKMLRYSLHGCVEKIETENTGRNFEVPMNNNRVVGLNCKKYFGNHNFIDFRQKSHIPKHIHLKWKKLDRMAARLGGARNIFLKLFGQFGAHNTFWLDSSSIEKRRARFSFMGGKGGRLWRQITYRLDVSRKGGNLSVEDAWGCTSSLFLEDGFFDFLNQELQSFYYDKKDFEGLPFDFHGGYVGYIGYDMKFECGMTTNRHESDAPDACFFFVDSFVAIDHRSDDVYILSLHDNHSEDAGRLDMVERQLLSLEVPQMLKPSLLYRPFPSFDPYKSGFVADKSREEYKRDVQRCLNLIKEGESYELCYTTQVRKPVGGTDPLRLYLILREENPAPYAAWLNFSKEDLSICCSSPEGFLRLGGDGGLEANPIKGTVSRGSTVEEDEFMKLKLKYSEKNQAENLMIVDLLRNDLGRVCEPGSVHVPSLMEVETYATVHTMVSTVRGEKRRGESSVDCVKAAFPGGSMTGAPKKRSVKLLEEMESCSRGIYSGCIGFFSCTQRFDLNMVIRTVVVRNGEASIGAGGAIVAQSTPDSEFEEMVLKTIAPARSVVLTYGCKE